MLNLLIDEYFQEVREAIEACKVVQSIDLICDKRSSYRGFIRSQINMADGSVFYLREFVDVRTFAKRDMYSYQYMDSAKRLIFRYDNSPHQPRLDFPNYPHHKHEGSEDNIVPSNAPMLADVLKEIERLLE